MEYKKETLAKIFCDFTLKEKIIILKGWQIDIKSGEYLDALSNFDFLWHYAENNPPGIEKFTKDILGLQEMNKRNGKIKSNLRKLQFIDLNYSEISAEMKRALIVKEAIELAKVLGNNLLDKSPFDELNKNKKSSEIKQINIIKKYADYIEEALEIKDKPQPSADE